MSTITAPETDASWPALGKPTLCAAFQYTAAAIPDQIALRTVGGGTEITWGQYAERVRALAGGLAAIGIGAGDVVALMLNNRPEHNLVDTAAMHLGAAPFTIYQTCPPKEIEWLLERSEARLVVTEAAFVDRVLAAVGELASPPKVIVVDAVAEGASTLEEIEATPAPAGFDFDATWQAIQATDVVTLIFTSGTTGEPKGVQHAHSSILFMLRSMNQVAPVSPGGRAMSFLPMAHIAERYISHYSGMVFGYAVTCVADQKQVPAGLVDTRPTRLFSVPRIYEKLHAALMNGVNQIEDPQERQLSLDAIATGLEKVRLEQAGEPVPAQLMEQYAAADAAVLSKLRAKVGLDQLEWPSVGAAPTPYAILEFFTAIGVPIQELWGMSEILLVTLNPPERVKLGTAGPAMPGVGLKLADDGEILISGGSLMVGYKNRPDLTAEAITDGWIKTGDIGTLDADGYLKITDRKKELIVNSAGKNMAPSKIEGEIRQSSSLIGQTICVGDGRLYNVALVTLDRDAATAWAQRSGHESLSLAELTELDEIKTLVSDAIEAANANLARVEQIKYHRLLGTEWIPGSEELTPTMKLRRKPIEKKYAEEIEALYAASTQAHGAAAS